MKDDRPSTTAQGVAMMRAAHQLLDDPRVFDDPVAMAMIGKDAAAFIAADPHRVDPSPLSSYLRAFLAVRSRIAEDELADGVRRGVRQYVVLGAGLDTFAYRNPYPAEELRVFEVDHPNTQAFKRARLAEAGIAPPPALTFAPVDFETRTLADGLSAAGCDRAVPTFFSWLGVTQYLEPETVMATLRFIASFPAESGVVFDYTIDPSLLTERQKAAVGALKSRTAGSGEPWRGFFKPDALAREMGEMGFGHIRDIAPDEINAHYFAGRTDGLRVGSVSHVMCGRV